MPDADWYFGPYFARGNDCFEAYNLTVGLSHVKRNRCAVDGGSHVGSWARELSKSFGRVLAFEPQADNHECAKLNLAGLENVRLYRAALGDKPGRASLDPGNNSGCWHIADGEDVSVVALDGLCIEDLDYLKLDVEGYEWHALEGARETIERCRPVVHIEEKKLPHSYDAPSARSLLEGMGYREAARAMRDVIFVHGA